MDLSNKTEYDEWKKEIAILINVVKRYWWVRSFHVERQRNLKRLYHLTCMGSQWLQHARESLAYPGEVESLVHFGDSALCYFDRKLYTKGG